MPLSYHERVQIAATAAAPQLKTGDFCDVVTEVSVLHNVTWKDLQAELTRRSLASRSAKRKEAMGARQLSLYQEL